MSDADADAAARAVLERFGLRVTTPRLAVLGLLAAEARPMSYSEVVGALGDAPWDPATVFRNLLRLTEAGLARVASHAGGMARYELTEAAGGVAHAHPHFVCVDCGSLSCLPEVTPPPIDVDPRWRRSVEGAALHLQGRCPDCLAGSSYPP